MPQPVSRDLALATDLDSSVEWVHCLFSKVEGDNNELFIEVVINDITERKQKEQRIRFEADHDPLTHALNRRAGENILQQHLDTAENKNESYAILLIDLDKFKPVNDNYGHEAGDSVLIQVTKRLQQNLRQNDLVIRWGGDEFVVALRNFRDSTDVATVAEKLVGALNIPIELEDGRLCQIGASIGIALYPLHGEQLNDLTACADIAMYDIKEHGRNGFCIFDNEPRKRVTWYLHKAAKTDNAASSTDACIMVIDDSADIRVFLRVLISGYGYRVLIAEDGRQALQMLREKKPDLILLDVMMPGLNGFDVCRQIKDMPQLSAVPILFLSAASGEEEKVRAFEMGGVDYITKPVQQAEVMARIRTHLALSLLQNELRDSHQALQQQHEELAAFTYTLTHDLSLPFQQLIALTQQYDVENCDAFGDLSHNLSKTAKTIAALSLLGEVFGQTEITAETLDMAAILHRALKRLDIPATIVVEQPATWPTTFGVANWIEEVWVQYINNALQYGGDNIKLDWEYGDGFVRFWTRDNGAGLSDAEQAKLFIPFARLPKDATAGHGLGLSIIRAIVLKLDGIVGVESTPQQGCQFYFTLPSASGEKLKT